MEGWKKKSQTNNKDVCPFDPFDNSTAVYVENGNPSGVPSLYTGVISQYKTAYIIRPDLMKDGVKIRDKLQSVEKMVWLNVPQFVGSFDVGSEVFFFFREIGLEYTNGNRKYASRVAKVCKNDKGGSSVLVNSWTTFQKARLNCSIPGEFPFYFDEIQDVIMYNNTFYALFTTKSNVATASAICAFEMSAIQKSFDGEFRSQQNKWLPIPPGEVPREAGKCDNDSLHLVDEVERFMSVNPLMYQSVKQQYGEPMFIMDEVLMQKLAIDVNESYDNMYVFFTGSNSGDVYKLLINVNTTDKKPQGHVANKFSVPKKGPIWSMKLNNDQIYTGTDKAVTQFSIITCNKHTKIDKCLYDPYCRWYSTNTKSPWFGTCIKASSVSDGGHVYTFDDIKSLKSQYLAAVKNTEEDTLSFKELNTTTLTFNYPFSLDYKTVTWTYGKNASSVTTPIQIAGKYLKNFDQSLIIVKFDKSDEGIYRAVLMEDDSTELVLLQKKLVVGSKASAEDLWMAKFEEWCDLFNSYKNRVGCTND